MSANKMGFLKQLSTKLGFGKKSATVSSQSETRQAHRTFFPQHWSPQEVVDAINEAYENRIQVSGNDYRGISSSGVVISLYIKEGKIYSAFPKIIDGGATHVK